MQLKKKIDFEQVIYAVCAVGAFLLIWQLAVMFTDVGKMLPGPFATIKNFCVALFKPIGKHTLIIHVLYSLARVLSGYLIAAVAGIAIGVLIGWFGLAEAIIKPIIEALRPIPAIAWIPIAIIWLGLGEASKLFIMFISAFMVIVQNTYEGVKRVDPVLIGAAKMLGASDAHIFKTIVLPASIPQIFAGLQNALSVAWMTVLACEMVRSTEGVGWMIVMGMDTGNNAQILVAMVCISIMGYLLATIMRGVEERLCAWNKQ